MMMRDMRSFSGKEGKARIRSRLPSVTGQRTPALEMKADFLRSTPSVALKREKGVFVSREKGRK